MKVSGVLMSMFFALMTGVVWGGCYIAAGSSASEALSVVAIHVALTLSAWLSLAHLCQAAIAAVREPQGDAE